MSPGDPEHAPLPLPAPVPVTEAEQLRLAEILMTPGTLAHRMGRKNGSIGTAPVEDAVKSGRPFFVQTEHLVLDVDRPDAAEALTPFVIRLSEAGITPVIIRTGRPGHRQLMAWVPSLTVRQQIRALARSTPDITLKVTARVPGTPHRISECPAYALDFPATVEDALQALRRPPERRLSGRMTRLLVHGVTDRAYGSPSELLQALILAMRRKGWARGSIRRALLNPQHDGGRAWRAQYRENQQNALRKLEQAIDTADAFIEAHPEESLRQRVRRTILQHRLLGRTGGVDTAVLHAIGRLVMQANKRNHHAATRGIAEQAGISQRTAARSLRRLERQGWLIQLRPGQGQEAAEWRLNLERDSQSDSLSGVELLAVTPGSEPLSQCLLSHDLWRYGVLGKRRGLLYEQILSTSHGTKLTGADREAVKRLVALKMAKPDRKQKGWFWKLTRDLSTVARELDIPEIGKQQRTKHAEERERYREHLNDHVLKRLTPELAWYRRRQKHLGVIEGGKE